METVKDKVERWILLADVLFKENKRVYIKNIYGDYFFGDIVLIGETKITIDCFSPEQRIGRNYIYWYDVSEFKEYIKEEGK